MGSALNNPHVGLLFLDFMKGWRLRAHGTAEVFHDDPQAQHWPKSQFIVRITVREVFGNCPRYIHKYQLVERSIYVPKSAAPVPEWKKLPDMNQVLAANDPARVPPQSHSL